jgi:lipopolysaccharide export system protein LptC
MCAFRRGALPGPGHIRRRQFASGTVKTVRNPNRGNGLRGKPLTSVYAVGTARRTGFSATSRGDAEQTYRVALRHSRLVRWLRVSVPAGIAAALFMVVATNYMPMIGAFRVPGELGKLVIKGSKITMQQPRLAGFTIDSRPYEFTAETAAQEITKPDLMELQQIQAKIEMEDKSKVNITSNSGTYEMKTEMLTLIDNVHVVSSTGYEVRLSEAVVDVHKGHVVSEKPVWVKLINGVINAKRLEVVDGGDVIRFGGGVAMTVHPDQDSTQASDR